VDFGIPLLTNLRLAVMLANSLEKVEDFAITAWNDYFPEGGADKDVDSFKSKRPIVRPTKA
jgi:hypothetical protein